MRGRRVLAIGLDGYEESLERRMLEAGELPALQSLRAQSARFLLDHGPAQRSGLAWEHVSTGKAPEQANRWAAVHFEPATYQVWQEGTRKMPFPARLRARTVVFDTPYFDMVQAPDVRGIVNWGAHDPGIPPGARPSALLEEFLERFGPYPAEDWIYGHVWASPKRTKAMGAALAEATAIRARAAKWLLSERLPEWDLGLVVVSEPHSAIEGLWHGVDPAHPLHHLPSGGPAGEGLRSVYRAVDRLVGDLADAFPDAALVVYSMGGMGANRSDIMSMFALPELLYRRAFGHPYYRQPQGWSLDSDLPMLSENEEWAEAVNRNFPASASKRVERFAQRMPGFARLRRLWVGSNDIGGEPPHLRRSVSWIPAAYYQRHWAAMPAFALPSYYDGRIRVNLKGRERDGLVPLSEYESICDALEVLLLECHDPATGESVVDAIERPLRGNPLEAGDSACDLVVVWKGHARALEHPSLGRIGPIPYRRPGGHTGPYGMAYLRNAGLGPGDHGVRSAFDVVPTMIELLGEDPVEGVSGASLLHGVRESDANQLRSFVANNTAGRRAGPRTSTLSDAAR